MYCVYLFQHKQSSKIYIGKTNDFTYRLSRHLSNAKHPKYYFHKAIAKYGIDSFQYFIIEEWENENECLEAEKFWIEFFHSNKIGYGYNLTEGGDGSSGYKHTPEARTKMRGRKGILNPRYGKPHSNKSRRKMSLAQLANHNQNSDMNSGENNPNSKLKESQVIEIIDLLNQNDLTFDEISEKLFISRSQVESICSGKSWKQFQCYNKQSTHYKNVGENNNNSKLSENDIVEMRRLSKSGIHYSELAIMYHVHKSAANKIVNYRTWKHLP